MRGATRHDLSVAGAAACAALWLALAAGLAPATLAHAEEQPAAQASLAATGSGADAALAESEDLAGDAALAESEDLAGEAGVADEAVEPDEPVAEDQDDAGDAHDASADAESDDADAQAEEQQAQPAVVTVSVAFVGADGDVWARVEDVTLEEGATAQEASLVGLARSGLRYEVSSAYGDDVLLWLARGYGEDPCATDEGAGRIWTLYLNGEACQGGTLAAALADGDSLEWRYDVVPIEVSVAVVGPGGTGQDFWVEPTSVELLASQSVWDASYAVFQQSGYGEGRMLSYTIDASGSVELDSLASLGSNGITGESWQVYVNGSPLQANPAFVTLRSGDAICWLYAGNGVSELPSFAEADQPAAEDAPTWVAMDGTVTQTGSWGATDAQGLQEALDAASGLRVWGTGEAQSLAVAASPLDEALHVVPGRGGWQGSLSRLLDDRLSCGQGGRAAFGSDGSLYYLDDVGTLVRLELR